MQPLHDAFSPWHDFYTLIGQASATMTGLLFVAASVGSGVFTLDRIGAVRMFLSASLVGFASVLSGSLIALAPLPGMFAGWLVVGCGALGLLYCAIAWRSVARDGIAPRIDFEDRSWYAVAPAIGYAVETAAGGAILLRIPAAPIVFAVSMTGLLIVAIHNAWDITVWSVTRKQK